MRIRRTGKMLPLALLSLSTVASDRAEAMPYRTGVAPTIGIGVGLYGDSGLALRLSAGFMAGAVGPERRGAHFELVGGLEYDFQEGLAWMATSGLGGAVDRGPCEQGFQRYTPFPSIALAGGVRTSHQSKTTPTVGLLGVQIVQSFLPNAARRVSAMAEFGADAAVFPAMLSSEAVAMLHVAQGSCTIEQ